MNNAMIEFILQCFAVAMAVAACIVVSTVCIQGFGLLIGRRVRSIPIAKIKDFVRDGQAVNVTLNSGKVYSGVTYLGFTDLSGQKGLPYGFQNWAVLGSPEGKIFVRPDSIKTIQEIAT
jgi:small nuclear ribonucleoprotein (snRNP)-like protein